jgi:hypothetical protein
MSARWREPYQEGRPMPQTVFVDKEVLRLAPLIFGRIRWNRSLGQPLGPDAAAGFRVLVQEHTASEFRIGPAGAEVIPGTGIWKAPVPIPCVSAPDEGEDRVVVYHAHDVHLNAFPDGHYRIVCELTHNWPKRSRFETLIASRRIEPLLGYRTSLSGEKHVVSLDFDVVETSSIIGAVFRPRPTLSLATPP